jgi:hypothetical protein
MPRSSSGDASHAPTISLLSSCSWGGRSSRSSKKCTRYLHPSRSPWLHRPPRRNKTDLFGQLTPRRCVGRLAALDTAAREIPIDLIRGTHEQKSSIDIDCNQRAFTPRAPQPPPDAGDRETKTEHQRQAASRGRGPDTYFLYLPCRPPATGAGFNEAEASFPRCCPASHVVPSPKSPT